VTVDQSKTLAELTALPLNQETISGLSSLAIERRTWLKTPLKDLSTNALWKLIQGGFGMEFLIPIGIERLENDCTLRAVLTGILMCQEFPWIEHPDLVRRLRQIVDSALAELDEWDGSREIVLDAMQQKIPILEAALALERSISELRDDS
jgi:hypothetical protein